jgi:hypothetical protein
MSIIRTTERRRESVLVLICVTFVSSCGDDGGSTRSTAAASGATVPVASAEPSVSGGDDGPSTQPTTAVSATTVPDASAEPSPSGGIDGPVVYAAAPNPNEPGVEAALGTGTVELEANCLLLGGSGAIGRVVILWQFGTTWNDDKSEVLLPDHSAVPIGSKISAGGGFHGANRLDDEQWLSDSDALERVRDCVEYDGGDNVFVLQEMVEIVP